MKRLRKIADEQEIMNTNESLPEETHLEQNNNLDTIKNLLVRIDNNVEDIKLSYYSLLENLNALSKEFPNVYNELKIMVKLPSKNDISSIADFKNDMSTAITMLTDDAFLSGLTK